MTGEPYPATPTSRPPRYGPTGIALFLAGVIVGGIAGGGASTLISSGATPGTASPSESAAPAVTIPPVSSAAAAIAAADPTVALVQEVSPSVVTVVNRLAGGQEQSSGSGFVIDAQRGYVVTNSHVVQNVRGSGAGASFDVIFADNRKVSGTLIGRDPDTDVAVLGVGPQRVGALPLGNSDDAPIGSAVVAIGSALGEFRNSVTKGVLSGKGRRLQSETDQNIFLEDLIQTDASISPGNSGGPLILVATKQAIGMNTLVIRAAGSAGLGFAISSNTVRRIADELIAHGQVERGRIGIVYRLLTARDAQALGLSANAAGALVDQVVPGSPAADAGLRSGDVITKVNDQALDEQHPLLTVMLRYRPGDKVRLTIVRDGKEQTVEVTLGRQT